jgi:hypothetical protein
VEAATQRLEGVQPRQQAQEAPGGAALVTRAADAVFQRQAPAIGGQQDVVDAPPAQVGVERQGLLALDQVDGAALGMRGLDEVELLAARGVAGAADAQARRGDLVVAGLLAGQRVADEVAPEVSLCMGC